MNGKRIALALIFLSVVPHTAQAVSMFGRAPSPFIGIHGGPTATELEEQRAGDVVADSQEIGALAGFEVGVHLPQGFTVGGRFARVISDLDTRFATDASAGLNANEFAAFIELDRGIGAADTRVFGGFGVSLGVLRVDDQIAIAGDAGPPVILATDVDISGSGLAARIYAFGGITLLSRGELLVRAGVGRARVDDSSLDVGRAITDENGDGVGLAVDHSGMFATAALRFRLF